MSINAPTPFDLVAARWPLHAQTIAERVTPMLRDDFFNLPAPAFEDARGVLSGYFVWADTPEGAEYWERLHGGFHD